MADGPIELLSRVVPVKKKRWVSYRAVSQLFEDGRTDGPGPPAPRASRAVGRGPGGVGRGRSAIPSVHGTERGGAGGLAAPSGRAEAGRPGPISQPGETNGCIDGGALGCRGTRRCRRIPARRGEWAPAGHAGTVTDQSQPGGQPSRANRPSRRCTCWSGRTRGRCPLALSRRESVVRGHRSALWPEPKVDPRYPRSRFETPETFAGRAARRPLEVQ